MAERAPLTVRDLADLAVIAAEREDPPALFAAADALVKRTIGHKLFTVMRVHEATQEVERLYSSNPRAYPVGGRKRKADTPWGRVVLTEGRVFVARTPEEIRQAFADHELISSLGIGSIMNVPIGAAGRRLGTMNVSHDADWFTPEDAEKGRVIAALLAPALLAGSAEPRPPE
jgi:GAF domain-containing protein